MARQDALRHGELLLLGLRTLLTVLGTGLHTAIHTLGIERTADDVVTHAREVLNTAATNQYDAVLLQVVADTRNCLLYTSPSPRD